MMDEQQISYRFGDFQLFPKDKQLVCNGQAVPLKPKALQTLIVLVERHGHLISKDDFLKQVWPDTFVDEVVLAQNISQLRRALRDTAFIETVPRLGYRFVGPVEVISDGPQTARPIVIAVLPFEMIGGSPDTEYLADGLTDEVIACLGQVDATRLQVIGRTSVMRYKRTAKPLQEIGREFGAAFLLESSMRFEGGRVRVTSKLIRASDQVQNWSASYDAEPSSMLAFQRELSVAIAEQVRLRLSPERLDALKRRQTRNAEAYDWYLRGRYYWNNFTPATTRRAIECFARATELDPQYALAWSGIADAFSSAPIHADADPADAWPKARTAAENALRSEPELPETQTSVGLLNFWLNWDWAAAETACRNAIRLDSSYSLAHRMLGILLAHKREDVEARQEMDRARSLDPHDAMHYALSAQVSFVTRDFSAAIQFARQSTIIIPGFWIGHYQLAQAYEQRGEYDLALEALHKAAESGGGNSKVLSLRGYLLAKSGRKQEADSVLETIASMAQQRYYPPYASALVHAGLGDPDSALQQLERAFQFHDVHLALLPADPKWDALRPNVRFIELLKRIGLPAAFPSYVT
jgi:DNA-binding winged helix-turn-helix (wHTH) protein/tetratricopeptide (TPR) repeat protein